MKFSRVNRGRENKIVRPRHSASLEIVDASSAFTQSEGCKATVPHVHLMEIG